MIIKNPNYSNEYYGMSTDIKPVNALNASRFYEIDTGNVYMFDEEGKQWFKQRGNASSGNTSGGSSGSGSSSGSGGILIANAEYSLASNSIQITLDKTWQEIRDATYTIINSENQANGEIQIARTPINQIGILGGVYGVTAPSPDGSDIISFTTDSPDGYPSVTAETSSSGTLPEGSSITPAPVPGSQEQAGSGQG